MRISSHVFNLIPRKAAAASLCLIAASQFFFVSPDAVAHIHSSRGANPNGALNFWLLGTSQGHGRCPPRLSYRNRSGDAESVNTMSNPASPLQPDFCTSPRFPPSLASESSGSSSLRSTNPSTNPSTSSLTPRKPKNASKQKKKGFLSGLFDVKEPSAQALIDYQKQILKQGSGRVTAVGLPGVSSAKLPSTVPKTNSKWDGVPQTVKERDKYHEKSKRYSSGRLHPTTGSAESSRSDTRLHSSRKRESRGGASSQSRGSSRSNLTDLYGWEVRSHYSEGSIKEKDFPAEGRRPSSAGTAFSYHALTSERDSSSPPTEFLSLQRLFERAPMRLHQVSLAL